ncbi:MULTISPECIES: Uma2 family endonuclease [unclassified Streptomyces]|uniref:Uma2 family endonuclease n=1 Tax=unclassified Streptomyces TaxID=2593676 RepID=UPI001C0B1D20|nr:Uma2 family endonuclease [Streptomyces sp. YPW6]QWQ41652.1 Uma2 family endonuclease [Streptomyces sp. YPW6]
MSAAPEDRLGQEPNRWPVPPEGGWTADDLDRIPGLPPHTELIDGSLVFMSPQRKFHTRAMWLLESALLAHVPADLDVDREMTIRLNTSNRPEPDLLVYRADADTGPDQTWYAPEDVVLAVEVVSPDSRERDRGVKPRRYAEAGIKHFWRVEQDDDDLPVVYVYELDPATRTYTPTGIHHRKMNLSVPFPIDVDLSEVYRRGRR